MAASSRLAKLAGGAVVYVAGVGIAYEAWRPKPSLPSASQRCCTFDKLAAQYDKEIEQDESTSGILELRKELTAQARGRVLEIAGGTGRNLQYYDRGNVAELVLSDASEGMLQVAAKKVAVQRSDPTRLSNVTLAVTDASALPLASASFDTVVDTFGLCSFEQPAEALREMRRVCKPGGQILLLEHGVSSWTLVAWWQQHRLNRHVVRWGCYWNRPILDLVAESGLRVEEVRRRHLGTTYVIRASPGDSSALSTSSPSFSSAPAPSPPLSSSPLPAQAVAAVLAPSVAAVLPCKACPHCSIRESATCGD